MIAVYQVSSFQAVRRTLSLSLSLSLSPSLPALLVSYPFLLPILQPLAVFPPRFSDLILGPIRLLSYEFCLNESLRRFHRFQSIIRVQRILLRIPFPVERRIYRLFPTICAYYIPSRWKMFH